MEHRLLFFLLVLYLLLVKEQYHGCLDLYLGFVLVRYGKVTDTGTIAFERRVYYLQLLG